MRKRHQYVGAKHRTLFYSPINAWKKAITERKKLKQVLRVKSELEETLKEVNDFRTGNKYKETLSEFLRKI